jgi:phosphoserine phosphatase RsbU/P
LKLSLRAKSLLAVGLATLLALLVAASIGVYAVRAIETHYGSAFARNYAMVLKQRIVAPVNRELALSLRLAGSDITRDWIRDELNPQKKALFFREAEGYRKDFADQSYFIASASSRNYFYNDATGPVSDQPRYELDPKNGKNTWFFQALQNPNLFEINVSPDPQLGVTKVWLNFAVKDGAQTIAVAGSGLDLTKFVENFVQSPESGVTTLAIDSRGAIQAHRDKEQIAFRSGLIGAAPDKTLSALLQTSKQREALLRAMELARMNTDEAFEFPASLDGKRQMMAVSWSPELKWYVVAAADLDVANVLSVKVYIPMLLAGLALFGVALLGFLSALNRILLKPIYQLTKAASEVAAGRTDFKLPKMRDDEIGVLTQAFSTMAQRVQTQRELLERAVEERTRELLEANSELAQLSERDELTGLGNRRMLLAKLKLQDIEVRRQPSPSVLSLAMLDLDHFKQVNDTYGHPAGDSVLIQVSELIQKQLRATDIVGRWGGEEFMVVLVGSDIHESNVVIERVLQAISRTPMKHGHVSIHVKASAGIAQRKENEPFDELIRRADQGLYYAKDTGRNRVILI